MEVTGALTIDATEVLVDLSQRQAFHHVPICKSNIHNDVSVQRTFAAHVDLGALGDDGLVERDVPNGLERVSDSQLLRARLCFSNRACPEQRRADMNGGFCREEGRNGREEEKNSHGLWTL